MRNLPPLNQLPVGIDAVTLGVAPGTIKYRRFIFGSCRLVAGRLSCPAAGCTDGTGRLLQKPQLGYLVRFAKHLGSVEDFCPICRRYYCMAAPTSIVDGRRCTCRSYPSITLKRTTSAGLACYALNGVNFLSFTQSTPHCCDSASSSFPCVSRSSAVRPKLPVPVLYSVNSF